MLLGAPTPGTLFISLDEVDRGRELRKLLPGRGRIGEKENAAITDPHQQVLVSIAVPVRGNGSGVAAAFLAAEYDRLPIN